MTRRTSEEWIAQYATSHTHPVNRLLHTFGIPMIAISLPLFVVTWFVPRIWPLPMALFAVGWIFIEYPDRIVLDLDPGKEVPWSAMIAAARLVRELLHTLDLECFVKTTGGRGLHLVVPLDPREHWEVCLAFARAIADALTRYDPALFTVTFGKRGRDRQILVDYLRNNRTNTSVAAFSTRAREGAPVSVPIAWAELTGRFRPDDLTVNTVPRRLERQRKDPWGEYFKIRQRFSKKAIAALEGI